MLGDNEYMNFDEIRKEVIKKLECKLDEVKKEDSIKYNDIVFELSEYIDSWIKDVDCY